MEKTSLERAPFARAGGVRLGRQPLRRASLLAATSLFLEAAPALAANECGPPPPGGGTVTCPAGEYPDGIDYVAPSDLEILLQPGVVTRDASQIATGGNIRLIGPTNTLLETKMGGVAVDVNAGGTAVVELDDIINVGTGGSVVRANGSISFVADQVSSTGPGFGAVRLILLGPSGQVYARVNRLETFNAFNHGIEVEAAQGAVRLELGTVVTRGLYGGSQFPPIVSRASGIWVVGRTVSIDVVSVTTAGWLSRGIHVSAAQDAGIVSGSVTTTGLESNAIEVSSAGTLAITSGRIAVSGAGSGGIAATSAGNLNITSQTLDVTAAVFRDVQPFTFPRTVTPFGIQASSTKGNIAISSGTLATTDPNVVGISAFAPQGNVTISAGSTTTGGSALGGGSVSGDVTINADMVSAGGARGISASTESGSAFVDVRNISVTGPSAVGIFVSAGRLSTVTIRGLASVGPAGFATVQTRGGPATVNILPGGTLGGRVDLGAGADRINNAGTFDAISSSAFGAGTDVFDNRPAGVVQSFNGAAGFDGLESFSNSGRIELRDGATGDSLTLAGYAGAAGGRLGLDVDFTSHIADRLITGAATGSTLIEIRPIGVGGLTASGILLVDAGAGTSATAFSLAPGTDNAYLRSTLRFDAANNDFLLDRTYGAAVFETARFGAMAGGLWYESADAVSAQLDTARDGRRGRGPALWLQGWTAQSERSGTQTLAGAGTFDVSFEQDFQGLQGGFGFQAGSAVFGITGGRGRSEAVFAGGDPVDMEVRNVGLYAQGRAGPLFFNVLAKRDWAELEIAPGAGLGAEFDADLFGVQANAGLRLGSGALYAEPSLGLSWVQADLESFESGPATVEPGQFDSLRARAGLRVGARVPLGGGDLLPFVAADVYEELGGRNESAFTLGETLRLFDEPAGSRGQAAAGVGFVAAGFEAFVRGEMDFSGGADARAVRVSARLRF
jgi:hypothetical protein